MYILKNKNVFRQALKEVMCEKMTEHEFVTLVRYFRGDPGQEISPRREMIRYNYAMCHFTMVVIGVRSKSLQSTLLTMLGRWK